MQKEAIRSMAVKILTTKTSLVNGTRGTIYNTSYGRNNFILRVSTHAPNMTT